MDGQACVGHFGQARAFATQNILHLAVAVGLAAAEEVHVLDVCFLAGGHFCTALWGELSSPNNESFTVSEILWILAFGDNLGEVRDRREFFE